MKPRVQISQGPLLLLHHNDFQRIVIYGGSGSGKSYLAEKLGKVLQHSVTHIDDLFWQPKWQMLPRETLKQQMHDITAATEWIVDGNYNSAGLIQRTSRRATLIIFLRPPLLQNLYQLITREISRSTRLKIGFYTRRPINVVTAPRNLLVSLPTLIKQSLKYYFFSYTKRYKAVCDSKKTIVLRSRQEINRFLEAVARYC